jgi:prolyl oligopeptidase
MKRFHTLLAGASWMAEYGDPATDDWEFLQHYSPYHSKYSGTCPMFDILCETDEKLLQCLQISRRRLTTHQSLLQRVLETTEFILRMLASLLRYVSSFISANIFCLPYLTRQFTQKLWDMGEGRWPVYYYENIEGGHGGAADAKQSAFMTALAYDFMFETLTANTKN